MPRNAELAAEIEQIVLHLGEAAPRRLGQSGDGEHHADRAVRLVHRAVGFHSQAFLGDPAAVAEARACRHRPSGCKSCSTDCPCSHSSRRGDGSTTSAIVAQPQHVGAP